jgi:Cu+-exporting ATPase
LQPAQGIDRVAALRLIAAVEALSQHPLARAIVQAAAELDIPEASNMTAEPGRGVRGEVEGAQIEVGKRDWLTRRGVDLSQFDGLRQQAEAKGQTVFFAASEGQAMSMLVISDKIKPTAKSAVASLQSRGVRVALISGDGAGAVEHLAQALGIEDFASDVLPEGKIEALEKFRRDGDVVAFVGDGINDAPVLAYADIGIAVGTGTDVAIDAADVVLMGGDPGGVATALNASQKTMRNIRQNLVWAFGYNVALIPVAAGILYPIFGILLSPGLAAGAMGLSSLFVLSNAFRLRKMQA